MLRREGWRDFNVNMLSSTLIYLRRCGGERMGAFGWRARGLGRVLAAVLAISCSAADDVTIRTVATLGQTAPGLSQAFFSFGTPVLNDGGRVAFVGIVGNGSPEGLWSEGLGALSLVAVQGADAPGTDLGNGPAKLSRFTELVLNEPGHTAFRATLTGAGVVPGREALGEGERKLLDAKRTLERACHVAMRDEAHLPALGEADAHREPDVTAHRNPPSAAGRGTRPACRRRG